MHLIEHDIGINLENQQPNRKEIEVVLSVKKLQQIVSTLYKPEEDRTEREMHDLIKIISDF